MATQLNDQTAIETLIHAALPGRRVERITDANRGNGVFSRVLRVELASPPGGAGPKSVVAKLPIGGPNGAAATTSGAYRREALAYRSILSHSPISAPRCLIVDEAADGSASFVLEDLAGKRFLDQAHGLDDADALAAAESLGRFHRYWRHHPDLGRLPVRRSAIAHFDPSRLEQGMAAVVDVWAIELPPDVPAIYRRTLDRLESLVATASGSGPETLCHGDPRASNMVFEDGRPILFDWQQIAVQPGELDVAWLAATSLTVETRRRLDEALVEAAGGDFEHYRRGLALPGLAVLLLAQRELSHDDDRRMVADSLTRIARALDDLDVAGIA